MSPDQGKAIDEYRELLTRSFSEARRILKPSGKATMVFHSASAEVWNALQRAYQDAGFDVEYAGVLDKKQGSFKQVTTEGAVRGDPCSCWGRAVRPRPRSKARPGRTTVYGPSRRPFTARQPPRMIRPKRRRRGCIPAL